MSRLEWIFWLGAARNGQFGVLEFLPVLAGVAVASCCAPILD